MYDFLFFRRTANIIQNLLKKKFFILNLFQHHLRQAHRNPEAKE
jgi:hypothetical protein